MSSKSLQISDELKVTLLKKLDALHDEEQTQQQAVLANGQVHDGAESSNGSSAVQESKSQLVLRHVLESGKFSTEKEVEDALNEYMKGRPLAYITGMCGSQRCFMENTVLNNSCHARLAHLWLTIARDPTSRVHSES